MLQKHCQGSIKISSTRTQSYSEHFWVGCAARLGRPCLCVGSHKPSPNELWREICARRRRFRGLLQIRFKSRWKPRQTRGSRQAMVSGAATASEGPGCRRSNHRQPPSPSSNTGERCWRHMAASRSLRDGAGRRVPAKAGPRVSRRFAKRLPVPVWGFVLPRRAYFGCLSTYSVVGGQGGRRGAG